MPSPSRKSRSNPRKVFRAGRGPASHPKRGWGKFHAKKKSVQKFEPKNKYGTGRGKVPKKVQDQIQSIRRYKNSAKGRAARLGRKYNQELERLMAKDYTKDQIARAKKYRVTGKVLKVAATSVNARWSKNGKTAYILKPKGARLPKGYKRILRGKFRGRIKMSNTAFASSMRMVLYHARIKHYKALYGLTQKEAQALYRNLKNETFGAAVFKALY